jgi:hypothetical protein
VPVNRCLELDQLGLAAQDHHGLVLHGRRQDRLLYQHKPQACLGELSPLELQRDETARAALGKYVKQHKLARPRARQLEHIQPAHAGLHRRRGARQLLCACVLIEARACRQQRAHTTRPVPRTSDHQYARRACNQLGTGHAGCGTARQRAAPHPQVLDGAGPRGEVHAPQQRPPQPVPPQTQSQRVTRPTSPVSSLAVTRHT